MSEQKKADLMLLMVTLFWGASCIGMKVGLGDFEPFNLMALRFVISFGVAGVIFHKRFKQIDLKLLRASAILGGILFLVQIFMAYGVKYTTASNAGFLTCLAGIFVPFFMFFIYRNKIESKVYVSVLLSVIGIGLLTLQSSITFNIGDLLCILCSVSFAIHIIATGRLTQSVDSVLLGVMQIGFVAFYSTCFTFILEKPILPQTTSSWLVVLFLSILCTALAFIVQTTAQKHTTPSHTGLIFSLEPAFAAIFAFIFLAEVLTPRGYLGAFLLFASVVIVEIEWHKKKPRRFETFD